MGRCGAKAPRQWWPRRRQSPARRRQRSFALRCQSAWARRRSRPLPWVSAPGRLNPSICAQFRPWGRGRPRSWAFFSRATLSSMGRPSSAAFHNSASAGSACAKGSSSRSCQPLHFSTLSMRSTASSHQRCANWHRGLLHPHGVQRLLNGREISRLTGLPAWRRLPVDGWDGPGRRHWHA